MRIVPLIFSLLFAGGCLSPAFGQNEDKPSPFPSRNNRVSRPIQDPEKPVASPAAKDITARPNIVEGVNPTTRPAATANLASVVVTGSAEIGSAFHYGSDLDGRKGASGETISKEELTAAHASLPMGTRVKVTNLDNGQSVVVRINDRFRSPRAVINMSERAANEIGLRGTTSQIKLEPLR